jgi:tetratricopeptide (TPR) repeat protein
VLADFHLQTDKLETAIFYFDQAREACLLLGHTVLLVESLIGLAACCGKVGAENEGIKILKKALEYAWMRGLEELELRIFDEIGRLHYYLGDLQKARQYHSRHINALHEPLTSALRQLSRQRIAKSEELNLETKYK